MCSVDSRNVLGRRVLLAGYCGETFISAGDGKSRSTSFDNFISYSACVGFFGCACILVGDLIETGFEGDVIYRRYANFIGDLGDLLDFGDDGGSNIEVEKACYGTTSGD